MAKFTYEVRVKNTDCKLVAQFICTSLKTACEKAEAAIVKLAGCTRSEVRQFKEAGLAIKQYCFDVEGKGSVGAFIYKNVDGYDVIPSFDSIARESLDL